MVPPSSARLSPLNQRRLANFKANRRGYWSFWIFLFLFTTTLFAEWFANDKPIFIHYDGSFYFPVLIVYPETAFGGFFETEAEYVDPEVRALIEENGWQEHL